MSNEEGNALNTFVSAQEPTKCVWMSDRCKHNFSCLQDKLSGKFWFVARYP